MKKVRAKLRKGLQLFSELLRGHPEGLQRVAAERLVPYLERHRNRVWADRLRIGLLRCQPGARAAGPEVDILLATCTLLIPPGWFLSQAQRSRLKRRLCARMLVTGAAVVSCDDWIRDGTGRWSWRQKPLFDPLFDAEVGIGEGPLLIRDALLSRLEPLPSPPHQPAWRRALHQRVLAWGGQAHMPLPLVRAPSSPSISEAVSTRGRDVSSAAATPALVSVLIPTGGFRRTIGCQNCLLVRHCLESLLTRSTYRQMEVVLIDGGELEKTVLEDLLRLVEGGLGPGRLRVLHDPSPYSYTRRINRAAEAAKGELLLQLNDDTELLGSDGIELLVEALKGPEVGVAGALLLYPNGRVQHAGTAIDNLAPRHVWAGCRPEDLPWGTLKGHRTFHAVTGAVSLCRRSLWRDLRGFSDRFPVNYGDVDFCLRAGELGLSTVLEPRSRWLHHESASRPLEDVPPELSEFMETWGDRLGGLYNVDPYCSAWRRLLATPRWNRGGPN